MGRLISLNSGHTHPHHQVQRGEWPEERLKAARYRFLEWELDRGLFGLEPRLAD